MDAKQIISERQETPLRTIVAGAWRVFEMALLLPTIYLGGVALVQVFTMDSRDMDAWNEHKASCEQVVPETASEPQPGTRVRIVNRWRCPDGEYVEASATRPPVRFLGNNPDVRQALRCGYWSHFLPESLLTRPEFAICPTEEQRQEDARRRLAAVE